MANYLNKSGLTIVLKNIKNYIDLNKQDTLVVGVDGNLKTIDGQSILRSSSSDSTNISTFTQIVEHGTNDTTFALTPQVYHVWDTVSSLSLSLSNAESGYLNEYLFQFTSPSNAATVVSLPQNVQWVHTPSFEAGKTYYVHIMNGLASYYTNNMIEGEPNVIESISVNSSTLSISNKNVDIPLKTINNMSIYGDGNINVAYEPDDELLTTSYNPIQNAVVTIALEEISEVTAAALTDLNDRMPTYVSDLINDEYYISYTLVPQYETDPVFVASPAYTITNANITYWNEKQPQSIKISISYENNAYISDIDSFASIQSYISEGRDVYVEYQDCIYRYEKFENGQYNFIYLDTDEDNVIRLLYVWDSDNNDVPDWAYQEHVFIPTKTSELTNDSGFISEVDDALSTTSYNPIQNKVITQALYDNEYVVATALNDLNDRMPTMLSELTNDVGYIYQETDPVFVASPAYTITNANITYWNAKQDELTCGVLKGTMYRDDVSGTGAISIRGTSGEFPTVTQYGTYKVIIQMSSSTKNYGLNVTFSGNTYSLSTTNGAIYDSRIITISEGNKAWSATMSGSVASNTILSVKLYLVAYDEITTISAVAVSNDYNDLYNKPTQTTITFRQW